MLEKPFKNHRMKLAVFKQDLSGLSGFSINRPNRSNLAGKPLKPLISWAIFERDLDPGDEIDFFYYDIVIVHVKESF